MSVTSGFFNSINGDRKYNAEQMSAIFDGIINDGILANIGTAFSVTANTGLNVNVGIGRAWFNSTWVYNDTILPLTLDESELVLDRIDAVVIEVDRSDAVRAGSIKVVKGSPSSTPQNPTMASTNYLHQYPLAYIYRDAGSTEITQADITSMIGTSSAPYVTGILQVQNIDNIVAQWGAQWSEWYAGMTSEGSQEIQDMTNQWNQWFTQQTSQSSSQISQWIMQSQADFEYWFENLEAILDSDVASKLTSRVVDLEMDLETLASEKCIYLPVEDDDGDELLDSAGGVIEGKTVFSGSSSDEKLTQQVSALSSDLIDHTQNLNNPHGVTYQQVGAAASEHEHVMEDLNGVLPIAKGGTGATDAATAKTNLGIAFGSTAETFCEGDDERLHTIQASTTDLTAGTSPLTDGYIYLVYE